MRAACCGADTSACWATLRAIEVADEVARLTETYPGDLLLVLATALQLESSPSGIPQICRVDREFSFEDQ